MIRNTLRATALAVMLSLPATPVWAGFEEGLVAFKRGDYETARHEFRPLAYQGNAAAQYNLGLIYDIGLGVPQNYAEAVRWYRKAANQGVASAEYNLGVMHGKGKGVPQDDAEAVKWYRKAANQGIARAQFNLGIMYKKGRGVPQDNGEALKWFRKAANQGIAAAQFNLGIIYDKGHGVPQDDAEAVKWYRKAANQGIATSQFNLGAMYRNGRGVPQDDASAVKWLRKAAVQGHAISQFNLGVMYRNGTGVPQDNAKAVKWYRKAAVQGHAISQYNLGLMYDNGQGVPQDDAMAVKWYRKAANQGVASAQLNLGFMYTNGRDVPQDDARAVKLFRKAANQSSATAQYNLGFMYGRGRGVPQDDVISHMWFSLAAAQGDQTAIKSRKIVAKRMTLSQLAEAQQLANNWRPYQRIDRSNPRRHFPEKNRNLEATGSGFFITADGFVLTNHHVIKGCAELRIKSQTVDVIAVDKGSDLALLKGAKRRGGYATFRGRRGVRLGEDIIVAGYPLQGLLTTNISITKGTVSAMAGPGDDRRLIQITAPVQPGNSGGPVFDQSGNVVGVVVSRLSALHLFSKIGSLPQNVNFAVSEGTARAFLDAENVNYKTAPSTGSMSTADIAAKAKGYTVLVECWN